jgi:hypothetical protein
MDEKEMRGKEKDWNERMEDGGFVWVIVKFVWKEEG